METTELIEFKKLCYANNVSESAVRQYMDFLETLACKNDSIEGKCNIMYCSFCKKGVCTNTDGIGCVGVDEMDLSDITAGDE